MNMDTVKTHLGYILGEMHVALECGAADAKENVSTVLHEMHVIEEIIRIRYGVTHEDVVKYRRAS